MESKKYEANSNKFDLRIAEKPTVSSRIIDVIGPGRSLVTIFDALSIQESGKYWISSKYIPKTSGVYIYKNNKFEDESGKHADWSESIYISKGAASIAALGQEKPIIFMVGIEALKAGRFAAFSESTFLNVAKAVSVPESRNQSLVIEPEEPVAGDSETENKSIKIKAIFKKLLRHPKS